MFFWNVSGPFLEISAWTNVARGDVTEVKRTKQRRVSATRCRMKENRVGGLAEFLLPR